MDNTGIPYKSSGYNLQCFIFPCLLPGMDRKIDDRPPTDTGGTQFFAPVRSADIHAARRALRLPLSSRAFQPSGGGAVPDSTSSAAETCKPQVRGVSSPLLKIGMDPSAWILM